MRADSLWAPLLSCPFLSPPGFCNGRRYLCNDDKTFRELFSPETALGPADNVCTSSLSIRASSDASLSDETIPGLNAVLSDSATAVNYLCSHAEFRHELYSPS